MPALNLRSIEMDAGRFAHFGQVFACPPLGETDRHVIDELQNLRSTARPRLSFITVAPTKLPLEATMLERHIYSSQAFVPLDCAGYLVAVAPKRPNGLPDIEALTLFRVPHDVAINYRPDIWHHPITVLDRAARFQVLTFIDGTSDDQEIVKLPPGVMFEL